MVLLELYSLLPPSCTAEEGGFCVNPGECVCRHGFIGPTCSDNGKRNRSSRTYLDPLWLVPQHLACAHTCNCAPNTTSIPVVWTMYQYVCITRKMWYNWRPFTKLEKRFSSSFTKFGCPPPYSIYTQLVSVVLQVCKRIKYWQ